MRRFSADRLADFTRGRSSLEAVAMLIAVWGASAGMGKSTLCAGLSYWLADAGLKVDHFREEEILTRPQFGAVADMFRATGTVDVETLMAASAEFVSAVLESGDDVVVADALVPFVPTLLAMNYPDETIDAFLTELTEVLAPLSPVMVFLDGRAEIGLSRAAAREDDKWLGWYVDKLGRYEVSPPVTDVASAVRYLQRERAVTLDAVRRNGWPLVLIEHADERSPVEVLQVAQRGLAPRVGGIV
ncbi:hypothetical protein GCM10009872_62580 [Actinopolymorpha rutila]